MATEDAHEIRQAVAWDLALDHPVEHGRGVRTKDK
jgi:hypothetical protein